ncbi:chemotaxis protein CheW, partial [Arthrospira platensis SPKY1]|nr:chemotaxis protein CheW [Arthrospira platensis SPKY1]
MSAKNEFVENSTKNQTQQFVCFKLGNEEYALDITYVKEVIRVPRVTYIPQMPDFCQGVINIRGNVI